MILLYTLSFLIGLFFVYILIPYGAKIYIRRRFLKRVKDSGYACLTFDDGPHPELTPKILDILKEAKVKATFFVLGKNVEKYPKIIEKILAMGHEIGNHTYKHTHSWKCSPLHTIVDLIKGRKVINKYLTNKDKMLFRPPYGKFNIVSLLYLLLHKCQIAFWNLDLRDYEEKSEEVLEHLIRSQLYQGSIVLLHDGREDSVGNIEVTLSALKLFLKIAAERGIHFATVQEIFSET